jgi:hypothetical protein
MRHQKSSPDFTLAIVRPRLRHVNRMDGYAKLGSGSDIQQIQHWRCLLLVLLEYSRILDRAIKKEQCCSRQAKKLTEVTKRDGERRLNRIVECITHVTRHGYQ